MAGARASGKNAGMFSWDDLRQLLVVGREGSYAAAAQHLGMDATTVRRRVAALERSVGAQLVQRTPTGVTLTPAGRLASAQAALMEQAAAGVDQGAGGADARVAGLVRVTASEALGARFITPLLGPLLERHPALRLELVMDARVLDIARGEADLALRMAPPRHEMLAGRRLGEVTHGLYASVGYLERFGAPSPGASLRGHRVIDAGSRGLGLPEERWLAERCEGVPTPIQTFSIGARLSAAVSGLGLAVLPCYLADVTPGLRRLWPEQGVARTAWLVLRRDARRTARVRAVADFLISLIAQHRALLAGELGPHARGP